LTRVFVSVNKIQPKIIKIKTMAKRNIIPEKSIYTRYIQYTTYTLVIVFILFASLYGYIRYTNKKAEKLYNTAIKILTENLEKAPNSKELEKAAKIFEDIIHKYSISKYSKLSMPFLGYLYFTKGDYDKAIRLYSKFKEKIPESSIEYLSLVNLAVSSCYEEKGNLDKAIQILSKFSKEHPESPFREFALLSLERLYRLNNQPKKAKEVIEEFIRDYPQSPFFYIAKAHLLSYNNNKNDQE